MDARLVTEALSRLNLTAPAKGRPASRFICQRRQLHLPTTPYQQRWAQRRALSASSIRRAPPAGAAAAQSSSTAPDQSSSLSQKPSTSQQPTQRSREMPSDNEIASFVDQSFASGSDSTRNPSRFKVSYSQQPNRDPSITQRGVGSSRFPSEATNRRQFALPENTSNNTYMGRRVPQQAQGDITQNFESAMRRDPLNRAPRNQTSAGFLDSFSIAPTTSNAASKKDDLDGLGDIIDQVIGRRAPTAVAKPLPKSSLRLGSSVGRSIEVDPGRGVDLARGIGMLEARLNVNKVKRDYARQKFHERPGLKRKRLKSQRWRSKFKLGFQTVVSRVKYLTHMGW